jgi:hypothetical protein
MLDFEVFIGYAHRRSQYPRHHLSQATEHRFLPTAVLSFAIWRLAAIWSDREVKEDEEFLSHRAERACGRF